MPILSPATPQFTTNSERAVWKALRAQLRDDDLLVASQRITDRGKDHEIDFVVVFADAGVVAVEVKGSTVWIDDGQWRQEMRGKPRTIHPVDQVRDAKYALRSYIERDGRWGSRTRVRWAHAVVLPYTHVGDDFAAPDCPRWAIAGRDDLDALAYQLRDAVLGLDTHNRVTSTDDIAVIREILRGRMPLQRDVIGAAAEREETIDRLTEQQGVILDAVQHLKRVEIRGGAGSGKTWLAVEQARRLTSRGSHVALCCYSRGLAAWMRRRIATFDPAERPAYVGTFHGLGTRWGAEPGSDDDPGYWEHRLPEQMVTLGGAQPRVERFDALVVDEAQDFADAWWPAAMAALRDDDGGLYVFTDEGQAVFSRYGGMPADLVPLVLDHNLRNTRPIAETFFSLAPIRMKLGDVDGPAVRLVECTAAEALDRADDEVDALLEAGWRPRDVALLATGSRHPEQVSRQESGQDVYWQSYWDDDQVFYGHVLGFKGLERSAVVLALNEKDGQVRARERLYVGLSRARDQLVVCGDRDFIADVGGPAVLDRLTPPDLVPQQPFVG